MHLISHAFCLCPLPEKIGELQGDWSLGMLKWDSPREERGHDQRPLFQRIAPLPPGVDDMLSALRRQTPASTPHPSRVAAAPVTDVYIYYHPVLKVNTDEAGGHGFSFYLLGGGGSPSFDLLG